MKYPELYCVDELIAWDMPKQSRDKLIAYMDAERKLICGKSCTINNQTLTWPDLLTIRTLINRLSPARPKLKWHSSFTRRLKPAWGVFTGRYDAIWWRN